MRIALSGFIALMIISVLPMPALADMVDDCAQSADPYRAIEGCTAAISSGRWTGRGLAWAYHNRGNTYQRLDQYERAIADYDQAIQLAPDRAGAYTDRGTAYQNLNRHQRAIADYDQAIRLDPDHALAYSNRGNSYQDLGQYQRAMADYNQAIRADPENAGAYNNRAWARYLAGQFDLAMRDVDRSLVLEANDVAAIDTKAHILAALGRIDEALAAFDRAVALGGTSWVKTYQKALIDHGHSVPVDGVWGPASRRALQACLKARCRLLEAL